MRDNDGPALRGLDIFFRRVTILPSQSITAFKSRKTILFVALASIVFVLLDVHNLRDHLSVAGSILVWAVAIPAFVASYVGSSLLWRYPQRHFDLGRLYLPALGFLSYFVTISLVLHFTALISGLPLGGLLEPARIAYSYAVVLVFEALFFAFVFPDFLENPDTPSEEQEKEARFLVCAGKSFPLDEILYMISQEHHVQVVTANGDHLVRGRLGDLVSQTQPCDGVLAHRSHWIARRAIDRIEHAEGNDIVVLKNGDRLPIARPRRGSVLAWVHEHLPGVEKRLETT